MTASGIYSLSEPCKCCHGGTYDSDRHNQIAQVQPECAYFKYEMKFSGSTGSFDSNFVPLPVARGQWAFLRTGRASTQTDRRPQARVWGAPFRVCPEKVAFDVSTGIVNQTAVSQRGCKFKPHCTSESLPA